VGFSVGPDGVRRQRRRAIYGHSEAEVRTKLGILKDQIAAGSMPTEAGRAPILRDYAVKWIERHEHELQPRTVTYYRDVMRLHILPTLGDKQVTKISPDQVVRLLSDKAKAGLSRQTVRHIKAVLRNCLGTAVGPYLARNPIDRRVKTPTLEKAELNTLSVEQRERLIDTATDDRDAEMWIVAVLTGARIGELLGLRWRDFDERDGKLHIRSTLLRLDGRYTLRPRAKTDKSRRDLVLPRRATEALIRRRARQAEDQLRAGNKWRDDFGGLVFTTSIGEPMHGTTAYHRLRDHLAKMGLPVIRFHDLRHTYATLALKAGAPIVEVSRALGHTNVKTTLDVYGHWTEEGQRELAVLVDEMAQR
jgi:integrase